MKNILLLIGTIFFRYRHLAAVVSALGMLLALNRLISGLRSRFIQGLRAIIASLGSPVNSLLEFFGIVIIYRFEQSVGDHLCMTSIVRAFNEQHDLTCIVLSPYPELFENNPRIWKTIDARSLTPRRVGWIRFAFESWDIPRVEEFKFRHARMTLEEYMRESKARMHLAEVNSKHFKIPLVLTDIRTEIFLTSDEIAGWDTCFDLPERFALIHSEGKGTYTPNKDWGSDNFQSLIDKMPEVSWVQIGLESDIKLNGCIDYRGRTPSVRELAYVISKAEFIVCLEGLYNHLASSVCTTSFVIFSGFHPPQIASYENTVPITCDPPPSCAPCWLTVKCPLPEKPCTSRIYPDRVADMIAKHMYVLRGRGQSPLVFRQ